jgi:AAA+ ATPase superfamily predicted ATPase
LRKAHAPAKLTPNRQIAISRKKTTMNDLVFVGRQTQLAQLNALLDHKSASLVVITGRRRIGKSRLVEEFAKNKTFYSFTGLPPTSTTTAQMQRDEFTRQLHEQLGVNVQATDWGDIFTLLAKTTQQQKAIIFLDEISWMGSKDPTFLGKLKVVWDLHFKKNPHLILVLCGSVSMWIEKNIINSTAFLGRVSLKLVIKELGLNECSQFLDKIGFKASVLEKYMLLAITGGVPWYLELINPKYTANENIKKLCFNENGILVDEFQRIFHDLFGNRSELYEKITSYLAQHTASYDDIVEGIQYQTGGPLSEYLNELVMARFIQRDFTWSIDSTKVSKFSSFRLSDNYLRFYFRYIKPNLIKINKSQFQEISITQLPAWHSVMGLQFENIVLNNRSLVITALGLKPEEIIMDNPFFQRATTKQAGCQIDYLIQTKLGCLYICEIKFSKDPIDAKVIKSMRDKIDRLKKPKNYTCIPVLIHVNGVSESLISADYFYRIIDFSVFIEV